MKRGWKVHFFEWCGNFADWGQRKYEGILEDFILEYSRRKLTLKSELFGDKHLNDSKQLPLRDHSFSNPGHHSSGPLPSLSTAFSGTYPSVRPQLPIASSSTIRKQFRIKIRINPENDFFKTLCLRQQYPSGKRFAIKKIHCGFLWNQFLPNFLQNPLPETAISVRKTIYNLKKSITVFSETDFCQSFSKTLCLKQQYSQRRQGLASLFSASLW